MSQCETERSGMTNQVSKDESWFKKKVQGFQGKRRRKRNTFYAHDQHKK